VYADCSLPTQGLFSPELKRSGRETDYSFSAEVKNALSSLYVFIAWRGAAFLSLLRHACGDYQNQFETCREKKKMEINNICL
jgi:hypothetical protein